MQARLRSTLAVATSVAGAVATWLALAACGQTTIVRAGVTGGRQTGECLPAPIRTGPAPAWTAPAWADSSPGLNPPYALASSDAAAAFMFAGQLRAGHPTNPSNKVLWVMRFPRNGNPLVIAARHSAPPSEIVRIQRPADSDPGEIYPSYIDLPRPGCWELALAWGPHRASLDVEVH